MTINRFRELIEESATCRSFALNRAEELAPERFANISLRLSSLKCLTQEKGCSVQTSR